MNSERFSDDKLIELDKKISEHIIEEREWKNLLRTLARDMKCLHDHMELYRPYLEGAIKGQAEMAALRRAIIEKVAIALVWASIAGLSVLIYQGMIEHLRNLFGSK